jgi:NitT/TauT family transport system substrate-binding protein
VVGLSSLLTAGADGPPAWRVLMQLWRSPQAVLLVSRRAVQRYLAPVQLSGLRIGIGMPSAAGSHAAWAALRKGGVATSAVDWVSLGASEGALAALEHMQVDALVAQDPVVSLLERDFAVQIAADTRTLTGSRALFGTDWVGTCLVARASWVSANAQRAQAAVSALARSLKWLQTAQAGDLVKVLPAQLGVGRVADHVLAFEKARSALSSDGVLSGDDTSSSGSWRPPWRSWRVCWPRAWRSRSWPGMPALARRPWSWPSCFRHCARSWRGPPRGCRGGVRGAIPPPARGSRSSAVADTAPRPGRA